MKVQIAKNYTNKFLTTVKGFSIKKDEIKEADLDDNELMYYIKTGLLVVIREDLVKEKHEEQPVENIEKSEKKKNKGLTTESFQ